MTSGSAYNVSIYFGVRATVGSSRSTKRCSRTPFDLIFPNGDQDELLRLILLKVVAIELARPK